MKEDLVSIITPTYNCASFIAETIESVRKQSYQNWEMLIVDDCSSDNTKDIVEQFSDDSRIKYYCLDCNSGAAVARNTALKIAKGRWIAFLDSDDIWSPVKLEKQIQFMKKKGIHFSYTHYEEIDEEGKRIGRIVAGPRKITRLGMLAYCWPGCLTVVYEKSTIGIIQIPNIKKNNDYAIWLNVIKQADCYLLKENLAKYRKRTGSISNANYLSLIKWHYKLFRKLESYNVPVAIFLTLNNLVFGILKKILYVKKYSVY